MKVFLRVLDRCLIHAYSIFGLLIALSIAANLVRYEEASFVVLKEQASTTIDIAEALHGMTS